MANYYYNSVNWQPAYLPWSHPTQEQPASLRQPSTASAQPDPEPVPLTQPSPQPMQLIQQGSRHSVPVDLYVKVLSSTNKKDFRMYMLRSLIREEVDSPCKLRKEIFAQCGESVVPKPEKMEVGYFYQSKKLWLNNRLDMNDVWELIAKGDKVTFWCVGTSEEPEELSKKRACHDRSALESESQKKVKKTSKQDDKKAQADDYVTQLQEKHGDKYTRFQYKLWAEMLATGVHTEVETPPVASMFSRENKRAKNVTTDSSALTEAVAGMVSVVSTLTQALSPTLQPGTAEKSRLPSALSPIKKAELRSVYLKQMAELRQLYDNEVLTDQEYEEQRLEVIQSMRLLKKP